MIFQITSGLRLANIFQTKQILKAFLVVLRGGTVQASTNGIQLVRLHLLFSEGRRAVRVVGFCFAVVKLWCGRLFHAKMSCWRHAFRIA
jgi:hypothetical protein